MTNPPTRNREQSALITCTSRARGLVQGMCVLGVLLGGAGCGLGEWARNGMKVGPNYERPEAPVAAQWIDYQRDAAAEQRPATELVRWWSAFEDPVLDSLISDAYQQNLTLRLAGERIAEARAVRGIAVGNLFPQTQELAGGYTANKASEEVANPPREQWFREAELGVNLSWELDFWGRFRRSIEAADAALDASVAEYDDVTVVLLADVASNYIRYRITQERLFLARKNLQIQQDSYDLADDKFRNGAVTERDAQQAKQALEQTRSSIPELEAQLRRTSNALCVLLGIPPQELGQRLGDTGFIPAGRLDWELGIPADLLRRRPDVRRAERLAALESAQIGIAKADLYPRFSLAGSVGVRSEHLDSQFDLNDSLSAFGGPVFRWDLLNYGRITSSVAAEEAQFRQAVLRYQDAVLRANREAEDAIVTHFKSLEQAQYLQESVVAARRTVEITRDQYSQGAIDFTPVFLFETTLTSQEDALARVRGDSALALVDLYRSLGGGWDEQHLDTTYAAPPVPAPTTQRALPPRPGASVR
jgi:NodT family efflux transporter outer membrane factor (OMF) lipoprotein